MHFFSKKKLLKPPTHPLRLINADNARRSCVTAAAGTCIGHGFSSNLITLCWLANKLYNYRSLLHFHQFAGSRVYALPKIPHCCLKAGWFSSPVWLIPLPTQLKIIGWLRYPRIFYCLPNLTHKNLTTSFFFKKKILRYNNLFKKKTFFFLTKPVYLISLSYIL